MHFSHFLLIGALAAPPAAFAFDQATAQQSSGATQNQGSDQSLQSSYGNALHAVDNLYQMNLPGAVHSGMQAYGQYQNSQQMTALQNQAQANAASMTSVGSAAPVAASSGASGNYVSPYQHLGTNFLYQGDTAAIAAKVESFTGVSRDRLFQLAVNFQSTAKSPGDPNFIPWAVDSFHQITAKVQSPALKDALTKMNDKVDSLVSSGQAKALLAELANGNKAPVGTPTASATTVATAEGNTTSTGSNAEAAVVGAEKSSEDPSAANQFGGGVRASEDPQLERLKFQPVDGFLSNLMDRAGNDTRSLFEIVSQKLRDVSTRQGLEKNHK